jgi:DNA-binding CsgD family transcriptional regulator
MRAARLLQAAGNAWLGGRADAADESLVAARRLAGPELRTEIDELAGHMAMRRGAVAEGYRMLVAVAETLEPRDRLQAIRILCDAVCSTMAAGNPNAYLTAAEHAIELLQDGDPLEVAAVAHVAYGTVAILAGRGDDGPRHLHEAAQLFTRLPLDGSDPLLLMCAGLTGLFLRESETGRYLIERALVEARDHAPTSALPVVVFYLGRHAFATDRWALARSLYEEAIRVAHETAQKAWLVGPVSGLAWLDALEGRADECRANAAEGLALAESMGLVVYGSWAHIAHGMLELGLGRAELALHHLRECEATLEGSSVTDPDVLPSPDIVEALVRLGRRTEAQAVATRYAGAAAAKGQPFALARSARANGLVADDRHFAELFDEALLHHESTPDSFERARTHLHYGERLRRVRKRVEARKHLRAALKTFDELGAAPWGERAMVELQASGETARVRDASHRRQLTPQELQVALTLAEGSTTREAAARLYLSPKTVEYHLRHVYDKLEIRSREELRAALAAGDARTSDHQTLTRSDPSTSAALR